MIIRQLKQEQYECFHNYLRHNAHAEPLDASYTMCVTVNDREYAVKLQPERHCKMAVLQAFRIDRGEAGPHFELITQGNLLSSFLEILIDQGADQPLGTVGL
ncbi:hypothetical protein SAMN02745823_01649 [Sporobacter termitidis DSM 10068]|uniref:Uncharacterized protein n=1 Tax=Sporobacter termitidis DSM 10068 TaxID=1123282 RepID=A0A1M5X6B3_9FIRM|nr:hypothetical protein [Sporobacter termitidis]SHH95367.1 hypothetical protein SAMN02745823_01649 [Sporobacter termitidis DSM 10068]